METKQGLARLSEAPGVSGYEATIFTIVRDIFAGLVDDVRQDALGSVIMRKQGSGPDPRPKLMIAAHTDEIGMIVTSVEPEGFLRVSRVGGVDRRILPSMEVIVHGRRDIPGVIGAIPPHLQDPADKDKSWKWEDLAVDCGLSRDQLAQVVNVGDVVSFRRSVVELAGERLAGKSFDDRAGVAAMLECARELSRLSHPCDVYFVATVQEEVSYGGGITATFGIMPDVGIAVDVGHGDMPGVAEHESIKIGGGPAIGIGPSVHPKVFEKFREIAEERGICYQLEASPEPYGTDAYAMQMTRSGVATGLLSVPLRYMHTSVETVALSDIKKTGQLLAYFASSVDSRFLEGLTCF
ncbi:MAG: M20/M25/M40 family metallo-hydrolase [Firmicutes bacterium]|nr:M20/M25/M40 family metallo-hydrolase [Bacillota bacterium]